MSMVLHLAVALVAQSGIVVFDGLAVGMSDQGRWRVYGTSTGSQESRF